MKKFFLLITLLLAGILGMAQTRSLLLLESFDGPDIPAGWSIMEMGTNNWKISETSNAGGQPNEMHLKYSPQFNGVSRLVTPAVDLTNLSEVVFLFKHSLDNYSGSHTLGVATSSDDGATWNIGWSNNYNTSGVHSIAENITTPDMGKPAVRFCIYYSGNSYNINDWYFDDIKILNPEEVDINLDKITTPTINTLGDVIAAVNVTNYGSQNITSIEASYQFEGHDVIEETFTTDIPLLGSTSLTFSQTTYLYPGSYSLTINVTKVNGQPLERSLSKTISIPLGMTQRYPMIEHFSSSTCGPCVSVNNAMATFENNNQGKYTYTKYAMNWPGSGDPYYTEEGGVRRYYYGVSAVPQVFLDGENQGYNSVSQSQFDIHYDSATYADIRGSFNVEGNNINIIADVMSYCNLGEEYKVYVSVNEKETQNNTGTNGEHLFHHVMMKMLENAGGNAIDLQAGSYQRYEFTYDMSSTHVEEMSDLEVSVWVQEGASKHIVNSHFLYPYTDEHPYPVQNLILEETSETSMTASWDDPESGTPTGYNVFLNGQLLAENITENSINFDTEIGLFYMVEVQAVYAQEKESVRIAVSKKNTWQIHESPKLATCRLYPNPAKENVHVESDNIIQNVSVYNVTGMLIDSFDADSSHVNLNISNYDNGVYFVRLTAANGSSVTKKLVVK